MLKEILLEIQEKHLLSPLLRYRLFAYGPADVTAIPKLYHLFPHLNPDWFLTSIFN